jgi:hypothetical protein
MRLERRGWIIQPDSQVNHDLWEEPVKKAKSFEDRRLDGGSRMTG